MSSPLILLATVAAGSALGGAGRYALSLWLGRWAGDGFPWATLTVNVAGSTLIGVIAAWAVAGGRPPLSEPLRLFLMVGVLGGFTTFSSFSLETLLLVENGQLLRAASYVAGSVALCLGGVFLGFFLAR